MDFFKIRTRKLKDRETKEEYVEIYPSFVVGRSKDLMVRGRAFYAIWDEAKSLWSTDEYDVPRLVDAALYNYRDEHYPEGETRVSTLRDSETERWSKFRRYLFNLSDNDHPLDEKIVFSNQEVTREDYASTKLDYPIAAGDISAWDKMIGTLYAEEERAKLEWAIGAIIKGDSRYIQKFMVLYGKPGSGKSTIMNVIEQMFGSYVAAFDAKALGSRSNQFATSMFATNPLVAIQQDGDLSKLEDNTIINTIVSHESITINEKNKPIYSTKINAFLFMGTNSPVKISDSRSGLIRRLIMVSPTGNLVQKYEYQDLVKRMTFEYGAIAAHCLARYEEMGFHYYDDYRPTQMMYQTDDILTFFTDNYEVFAEQEYTTMKQAYALYLEFCSENGINYPVARKTLMHEMSSYFEEYHDRVQWGGERLRTCFSGFKLNRMYEDSATPSEADTWIDLQEQTSRFDNACGDLQAQYTNEDGTPLKRWVDVKTTLSEIDTGELHYVLVPENHIIIDLDLTDDEGNKSLSKNLAAAAQFPATYAEVSKSGGGLHLHYIYDGDPTQLAREYSPGIEIKVYTGASSLRRLLTLCTDNEISHISSGLPIKENTVSNQDKTIRSEKALRALIDRNIRKEIQPGTKPSIQFIHKILEDAYASGLRYDVSDMRAVLSIFASNSSNHALDCIRMVNTMKFEGQPDMEEPAEPVDDEAAIVFFDVEVYPNLFLVGWKYAGSDTFTPMINPKPHEIEGLFKYRLIGFNNRSYDNHILYARFMGYSNEELFELSKKIVNDNDHKAKFGEAYGLSYADIYDISSKKQSLKKFEIEYGIKHMEMDIPWDVPVKDSDLDKIIEYNKNDVDATEVVWNKRQGDVGARTALSHLSGLPINDPTRKHAEKIVFGNDRNPQKQFLYTDLATGEVY